MINRNTVKMSYRTMPNFGKIVKGLDKKVTEKFIKERNEECDRNTREQKKLRGRPKYVSKKGCNCDSTHPYPLEKKCNRWDAVYKAVINSPNVEINNSFYVEGAHFFHICYKSIHVPRDLTRFKTSLGSIVICLNSIIYWRSILWIIARRWPKICIVW